MEESYLVVEGGPRGEVYKALGEMILEILKLLKAKIAGRFSNPLEIGYLDEPWEPVPFYFLAEATTQKRFWILERVRHRVLFAFEHVFYRDGEEKLLACEVSDPYILEDVRALIRAYRPRRPELNLKVKIFEHFGK